MTKSLRKTQNSRGIRFIFSNVKNLKIPERREINPLAERIIYSNLKSILKYRKHPSVIAIGDLNIRSDFWFSFVSFDEVLKEIKIRCSSKSF